MPAGWALTCEHVLTGIPDNDWSLALPRGTCLDIVPFGESAFCVRVYGIDDLFRGPIGAAETTWVRWSTLAVVMLTIINIKLLLRNLAADPEDWRSQREQLQDKILDFAKLLRQC